MLELDGERLNKEKLVSCYLKKKSLPITDRYKYDDIPETELIDLIQSEYAVKGDVNYKSLAKARKIDAGDTEHDIQVKVIKYLKEHNIGHFAVPNGFIFNGDKLASAKYLNYMKSEGLKRGVFDIVILSGNGKVVFLELKTKTGKPSEYQLRWQKWFNDNNYLNKICYGYEQAIEFIESEVIE